MFTVSTDQCTTRLHVSRHFGRMREGVEVIAIRRGWEFTAHQAALRRLGA